MQEKVHYVRVLPRERGRSIILSKDRRVRQRWRSRRGRRASERSRRGSGYLRGGDSEADRSSLLIGILGKRASQQSNF
jgi:hypothetical protein